MFLKLPENNEKIFWTQHSKDKMRQYQLSDKRVLKVLRKPDRKEEGVAPNTLAVMQITGTKKHPTEIWLMYQTVKVRSPKAKFKKIKIISTWRYPARSPIGKEIPIPPDILEEIQKMTSSPS